MLISVKENDTILSAARRDLSIRKERVIMIYTVYAESENITFIMEEANGQTACSCRY